jgi:hypothetical protein
MTSSVLALVTAVGCFGAEAALNPILNVRRVYVDRLSGENAAAIRDMIINAIQNSAAFRITEDAEKADAILRGSADDQVFTDQFQSSEGVHAGASIGSAYGSSKAGVPRLSATVGDQESIRTNDRKHEATVAVRLVAKDGDVIWSTTQESQGGKFKGAASDVAEKVVRQLLADVERAHRPAPSASGPAAPVRQ